MAADVGWSLSDGHLFGVVDVELTNRCNASCSFCPRDQTPAQGVMSSEVFAQVMARVVEIRDRWAPVLVKPLTVSFCGLGEQLLNRQVADFVGSLTEVGVDSVVNTNGALLDERRGQALLDAGVESVVINGGEIGDEYESTYQLPFGRTSDNIARFVEQAADTRCRVFVALVDHAGDPEHVAEVERHWRDLGVFRFFRLDLINRAGSLLVESMLYSDETRPTRATDLWRSETGSAVCDAPFHFPFIGHDGSYYLCSSDWQKEVPVGNVFDQSIEETMAMKLQSVASRSPICRNCNHDPLNRLADRVKAVERGDADEDDLAGLVAMIATQSANLELALASLGVPHPAADRVDPTAAPAPVARRLIPVEAR